ncbi:hypothetical protein M569_09608, partial [Genlisea aurea]
AWTSKISRSIDEDRPGRAIDLFKNMLADEKRPNFVTILCATKAAGLLGSRDLIRGIHGHSMKLGFLHCHASAVTALATVYSSWDMTSSWKLYHETLHIDLVFCTAMISACIANSDHAGAFELLKEILFLGMQPNHITVATLLSACADLAAPELGKQIHSYSIRRLLCCHVIPSNSLLDMYSKCGLLKAAIRLFRLMPEKDIVSWRIIIRGCSKNESPLRALEFFREMRASAAVQVDEHVVKEIIGAFSQLDDGNGILRQRGVYGLVWKMGLLAFVPVATELMQVHGKFRDIQFSRYVFDQIHPKDIIAWSAMVSTYAQNDRPVEAFDIFKAMHLSDQKPNEFTFVSLLFSCTSSDAFETGRSIHSQIIRGGYLVNSHLTSALIDMYCNFGKTREGNAVFIENSCRDFICWSSMINGYAINGFGGEALKCFSDMLSCGIEPNDVVFVSALSACSHCGLDYEGWNLFHAMEPVYGVEPKLAHYACMVDMLSRQGNLEEALDFVDRMPVEPDNRIWGALLSGCRNAHPTPEILKHLADEVMRSYPKNTSYLVALSNQFADQGRWEEAEKLRDMIDFPKSTKK